MVLIFSILFVIVVIVTILVLCVWLMHHAGKDYYPDIKDL
jgi:heme/copper-type cytochrome/quinol oxidase subunit 4